MPIEREPRVKVPAGYVPPDSTPYRVKDGDSWESVARANGLDAWALIETNFKTRNPDEVNWYLRTRVGCRVATADGKNWRFSSSASPGVIHLPQKKPPLFYIVPDMALVAQDKNMSCWYASGQMLIQWRQRMTRSSEMDHPDPSLVTKWHKLYDDNPGISNAQIDDFANDLGLELLGPVSPSPEYLRDILRTHGPIWVNGKTHITVIAGIRTGATGAIEVLVYDPAKAALIHGEWRDYFQEYGVAANTSVDASPASKTSMLYIR